MQKFGVVREGITPSCISGKPSSVIVEEEAFATTQESKDLKKVATLMFGIPSKVFDNKLNKDKKKEEN